MFFAAKTKTKWLIFTVATFLGLLYHGFRGNLVIKRARATGSVNDIQLKANENENTSLRDIEESNEKSREAENVTTEEEIKQGPKEDAVFSEEEAMNKTQEELRLKIEEEKHQLNVEEATKKAKEAEDVTDAHKHECIKIIIKTKLQAPKLISQEWTEKNWGIATTEQKESWNTLDCVTALSLYDPKVLDYNDTLPQDVFKSVLSINEQQRLFKMTKSLIAHLLRANVRFTASFGTLLGIARNGIAILPWDDDVDFIVEDDGNLMQKLTKGLKKIGSYTGRRMCWDNKDTWELPDGTILLLKKTKDCGMPWKVYSSILPYPSIDINTFQKKSVQGKTFYVTPEWELENGHLHKSEKLATWFGSMNKTMDVAFSTDIPSQITVPVPDNIFAVVKDDYGEEGLTNCEVSHIHKIFCVGGSSKLCENSMANHLAKLKFPCVLLPAKFHGMSLSNEEGYKGRVFH